MAKTLLSKKSMKKQQCFGDTFLIEVAVGYNTLSLEVLPTLKAYIRLKGLPIFYSYPRFFWNGPFLNDYHEFFENDKVTMLFLTFLGFLADDRVNDIIYNKIRNQME